MKEEHSIAWEAVKVKMLGTIGTTPGTLNIEE